MSFQHDHIERISAVFLYQAPAHRRIEPSHIGPNTELVELVLRGRVHFHLDGHNRTLGCGALFWHLPGEDSIHLADPEDPYACLAVRFITRNQVGRQLPRCNLLSDEIEVARTADEILRQYHRSAYDQPLFCAQVYTRLQWLAHQSSLAAPDPFLPPALRTVTAHLDHFFAHEQHVEQLARRAGYSPAHLHELFQKHLHTTPHRYLLARRIRAARHLLATSELAIRAVAQACGFSDPVSFSRRFRREVGVSPSTYRRQHALRFLV